MTTAKTASVIAQNTSPGPGQLSTKCKVTHSLTANADGSHFYKIKKERMEKKNSAPS